MAEPMYLLTKVVQGFPFLHILASICFSCLFDTRHADTCEVISHGDFDLYESTLSYTVGHLHVFFGKMSIQVVCQFFNLVAWCVCVCVCVCVCLAVRLHEFLILVIWILSKIYPICGLQIFSPIL